MAQIDTLLDGMADSKELIRKAMARMGMEKLDGLKLAELAERLETASEAGQVIPGLGCTLTVTLNDDPEAYVPSGDKSTALLVGATLTLKVGTQVYTQSVPSLASGTQITFSLPWTVGELGGCTLRMKLNEEASAGSGINVPAVTVTLSAGVHAVSMNSYYSVPKAYDEVGFRIFTGLSFGGVQDVLRTVNADGTVTEQDTGYLDASTGQWVSTSPIERAVPKFDLTTGEITEWLGYRKNARNDIFGYAADNEVKGAGIYPFNAIMTHEFKATYPDNLEHVSVLVGIGETAGQTGKPYWWEKRVRSTAMMKTLQADGSITESEQATLEVYFAKTQLDAGYRLVECDYIGRYINTYKNINVDGVNTRYEWGGYDNTQADNGTRRDYHQSAIFRMNELAGTWDGEELTPTAGQFAHYQYKQLCQVAMLCVMACGTRNVQDYILGHCSVSGETYPDDTRNHGVTKPITDAGYMLGVHRPLQNRGTFVMLGIENIWGNIGYFTGDVTNIGGTYWIQPDTTKQNQDWTQVEGYTTEELAEARGYRKMDWAQVGGWCRELRFDETDPDIFTATTPTPSNLPSSAQSCYGDHVWHSSSAQEAYLVASGSSRGLGLDLGAFCVNGTSGWASAYGDYRSSRLSFRKLSSASA